MESGSGFGNVSNDSATASMAGDLLLSSTDIIQAVAIRLRCSIVRSN